MPTWTSSSTPQKQCRPWAEIEKTTFDGQKTRGNRADKSQRNQPAIPGTHKAMCRTEEKGVDRSPRLHLEIVRGHNFERRDNAGPCNTSCLVRVFERRNGIINSAVKGELSRTTVQRRTSNPEWNERFSFNLTTVEQGRVELSLWDSCLEAPKPGQVLGQATWIGQIVINTAPLVQAPGQEQQLHLTVQQEESCETRKRPSLCVKVRLELGIFSQPKQNHVLPRLGSFSSERRTFCDMAQDMNIFRNMDRSIVLALCKAMTPTSYSSNALVFAAGTFGKSMYFVLSGKCVVVIAGKAVVTLHSGDHFGEVALLNTHKRTADVYTTEDTLLMEITQDDLHQILGENMASASVLYANLREISEQRVRRNCGELEQHPSALGGGAASTLDGSAKARDRKQRVYAWHQQYSTHDEVARVPSTDECMEEEVGEASMMSEAKRLSGVDDKVVAVLKTIALFQDIPARALAQVVSKLKVQEFESGETIIEEGTEGSSMYIIDEGQADVLVKSAKVSEMSSHSFFGEVALVTAHVRTATVVATERCRCLLLEQNDIWTVFNMFPTMYKTLAEVADARVHNASSSSADAFRVGSRRQQRHSNSHWSVKFRAPLRLVSPEQAGVAATRCFSVRVLQLQAAFDFEGDKSDRSTIAFGDGHKVLYRSWAQKGQMPSWTEDLSQQHQLPYDVSAKLTFALHRTSGTWSTKEHPAMTGSLRLCDSAFAPRETKTVVLSDAHAVKKKAGKESAESTARLRLTLERSPPTLQPFLLWVPICGTPHSSIPSLTARTGSSGSAGRTPSDGALPSAPKVLPILDRAGNSILWARWRVVPEEDSGEAPPEAVIHNKYVTVIDLATADGAYGGQVVTDVTAGSHARSRIMTGYDVHWATVKTKMQLSRQNAQRQPRSPSRSPSPSSPSRDKGPHSFRSRFKVVPIYSEFEISSLCPTAMDAAFRTVALTRTRKDGQRTPIGTARVAAGPSSHIRLEAEPQQDLVMLVLLALACGESQCHAPLPALHTLPDAFDKSYQPAR